jgi:hypothetical protein
MNVLLQIVLPQQYSFMLYQYTEILLVHIKHIPFPSQSHFREPDISNEKRRYYSNVSEVTMQLWGCCESQSSSSNTGSFTSSILPHPSTFQCLSVLGNHSKAPTAVRSDVISRTLTSFTTQYSQLRNCSMLVKFCFLKAAL